MAKSVDTDSLIAQVADHLTGQATIPRSSFAAGTAVGDVDTFAEMERRAALFTDKLIDDAHKSVTLNDLGVKVLNNADRQREVLRLLDSGKRAKLAAVAGQLNSIADRADRAGFRKQAADLRFAAAKLV